MQFQLEGMKNIGESLRREMEEYGRIISFGKSDMLFDYDEVLDYFYIILSGKVKIYHMNLNNGKEQTLYLLGRGDMYDTVTLLDGKPHEVMSEVLEGGEVLRVPIAKVREWIYRYPVFGEIVLKYVASQVRQVEEHRPAVEIQYRRVVRPEGNPRAQQVMKEVYGLRDDWWRGLGVLAASGLAPRERYAAHDAEKRIPVEVEPAVEPRGCICGEVLKGVKRPVDCPLFGGKCTPSTPVGACMVSPEGACQAWHKYKLDA